MKQPYLAILDRDEVYAKRMVEFMNRKQKIPFRIGVFSSREALEEYAKTSKIDLLLLAENSSKDGDYKALATHVILLDEGSGEKSEYVNHIYKYQSAENIMKNLMWYLSESDFLLPGKNGNRETKIITFYTPINRCLQTSTALRMAGVLAEKKRVLFINLEPYSTLENLLQKKFRENLSDLLYYSGDDMDKFAYRLSGMILTENKVDILPPIISPEDLISIEKERWLAFFSHIKETHCYDVVVVDLGEAVQGYLDLLGGSDQVLQIVKEDEASKAVLEKYQEVLNLTENQYLNNHTKKIYIPRIPQFEEPDAVKMADTLEDFVKKGLRVG